MRQYREILEDMQQDLSTRSISQLLELCGEAREAIETLLRELEQKDIAISTGMIYDPSWFSIGPYHMNELILWAETLKRTGVTSEDLRNHRRSLETALQIVREEHRRSLENAFREMHVETGKDGSVSCEIKVKA